LFEAFPFVQQWREDQTTFKEAYSYGDSSGFTPGSLLMAAISSAGSTKNLE
jgi:hypothetical protein